MDANKHWHGFQLIGSTGSDANDLTQYEVYRHGKPFAYIRLRHNVGSVSIPPTSREGVVRFTGVDDVEALLRRLCDMSSSNGWPAVALSPETLAWAEQQARGAPLTNIEAHELAGWFENASHDEESFEGMEWILPKFSRAAKYLRAMAKQLMEEERTKV